MASQVVDWDATITVLKSEPSLEQLNDIVSAFIVAEKPPVLAVITTLLNYTVPQTYTSLPQKTQKNISRAFQSLIGLGNLYLKISLLKNQSNNDEKKLLSIYLKLLSSVFNEDLIPSIIRPGTKLIEVKETDKLLFKGKVFATINEIYVKSGVEIENKDFSSSNSYAAFLNLSLLQLHRNGIDLVHINIFLSSILNFNTSGVFQYFDLLFDPDNWTYFLESFYLMKKFQKKEIISRLFTQFINKNVLARESSEEKLLALFHILEFSSDTFDENIVEKVISSLNFKLNTLVSLILTKTPEEKLNSLIIKILEKWSDENIMKTESIVLQEYRTHFAMHLLYQKRNTRFLEDLMGNKIFLDAISNRLQSFSDSVKSLGVILADKVCEFNGKPKIFNLDGIQMFSHLIEDDTYVDIKSSSILLGDAWKTVKQPMVEEPPELASEVMSSYKGKVIDSDDESEDESDGDDPSLPANKNVADPLYIKDLLEYITVDTKKPQAYEMRRKALKIGPTLIRQKFSFGSEVQFYSEDLATNLVGMTNYFDDKDFESSKLNCLISVIVGNPKVTHHMCKLLLTGDYSLQQRMCILSSFSLAARELRGFKDEAVISSYETKSFPSKRLPDNLHLKYLSLEDRASPVSSIERSIQDGLMAEASNEASDKIVGGKVLRISSKFKRNRESVLSLEKPKFGDFYRIIGKQFFFPLINVWYETGEIDIGHYTTVFMGHYIQTLSLLLHCAYPSASNLRDMIKEFYSLVVPLLKRINNDELQIIESAVTGFLLIFDIVDEQYLITTHLNEIQQIQTWLSISWESIIDNRVKSICAGLLLRISTVSEAYERTILDQVNSLY
ncbi:telomere length regulation protein-domain-containing protein [Scheffersomyces xylosifermentans]|uniref:telomere length regulation protein-domain-containing protein n=1 Tax=Scheffersomyces xylosifermentans TaxID=1304137 RepID=UPI00315D236E